MIMIPTYALDNFKINPDDDKQTILNKRFLLEKDRINRQMDAKEKLKEFNDKYDNIKKMKQSMKTNAEKLTVLMAIDELLGE